MLEEIVASEDGYLILRMEKGPFCPLNAKAAGDPEGVSVAEDPSMEAGLDF